MNVGVGVLDREVVTDEGDQLPELLGEVVRRERSARAAKGAGGRLIGAGGTSDPQVDPAGMQCLQGAELLGHDQRRVVRQQHAAGAHPQRRGGGGEVTDHDGR